MKQFTQEEFDSLPIMEGYKICPTGDYSLIEKFGYGCEFVDSCKFGNSCEFADSCKFGYGCEFADSCKFGYGCEFADSCKFGEACYIKTLLTNT